MEEFNPPRQWDHVMVDFDDPIVIQGNKAARVFVLSNLTPERREAWKEYFVKLVEARDGMIVLPGINCDIGSIQPAPELNVIETKEGDLAVCFEVTDDSGRKRSAVEMKELLQQTHKAFVRQMLGGFADQPATSMVVYPPFNLSNYLCGPAADWVALESMPMTLKGEVINHLNAERGAQRGA